MDLPSYYHVTLVCLFVCLNNRNTLLLLGVAGIQVTILTKSKGQKHVGLELPGRGMKWFRITICGTNSVSH